MQDKRRAQEPRRKRGSALVQDMLVIAFCNQKGGVGKTTMVLNLAIASLRNGTATTVLDLDTQKSAERFAELRSDLTGEEAPVVVHGTADSLKEMVEAAREGCVELLLLDCPGALDRTMLLAATLAHIVVVPTRSSVLDQHALRDTLDYLDMSAKIGKCLIVLNAAREGRDGGIDEVAALAREFGVPVAASQLEDQRAFSITLAKGRSVVEAGTRSKAAQSVEKLLAEIIGHHKEMTTPSSRRRR